MCAELPPTHEQQPIGAMYVNTIAHSLLVRSAGSIKRNLPREKQRKRRKNVACCREIFPRKHISGPRNIIIITSNSYFYLEEARSKLLPPHHPHGNRNKKTEKRWEILIEFSSAERFFFDVFEVDKL